MSIMIGHSMKTIHQSNTSQHHHHSHSSSSNSSPNNVPSRILTDIPCKVCNDNSSGKHYGIYACDGCAGFFKRSIRRNRQYVCKNRGHGGCQVDKIHRNQCRSCRLKKCVEAGMNRDAVQHERGPRNSTIRRQMALFMKESNEIFSSVYRSTATTLFPQLNVPQQPSSSSSSSSSSSTSSQSASHIPQPPLVKTPPTVTSDQIMVEQNFTPTSSSSTHTSSASPSDFDMYQPNVPTSITPSFLMQIAPHFSPYDMRSYFNNPETVCETAARLLFMFVTWVRSIPAFTNLDLKDQLVLLEDCWKENFILLASQFQMNFEIGSILANAGLTEDTLTSDELKLIVNEARNFQDIVAKFRQLQVDANEYACLKTIILFKTVSSNKFDDLHIDSPTHKSIKLKDFQYIQMLHEQTQLNLNKYTLNAYPTQPYRYTKLVQLLTQLHNCVSAHTIENLFFKKTIGSISIERVILDMYKSNIKF